MNKYRYVNIDEKAEQAKVEKIAKMLGSVKSIFAVNELVASCNKRSDAIVEKYRGELKAYLSATRIGTTLYFTANAEHPWYGRKLKKEAYRDGVLWIFLEADDGGVGDRRSLHDNAALANRIKKASDLTDVERADIFTKRLELFNSPKP